MTSREQRARNRYKRMSRDEVALVVLAFLLLVYILLGVFGWLPE